MFLFASAVGGYATDEALSRTGHDQRGGPETSAALTPAGDTLPTCEAPSIELVPLRAGRVELVILTPCRRFEAVRIRYAGVELIRAVDQNGQLNYVLDCFAGDAAPVEFIFADGSHYMKKITTYDLADVTKIAVMWNAPVNLDLHAFEYAASADAPGHVWAGAPSSDMEALRLARGGKRGHGFMSTVSTGKERGGKLEVYTFWHHRGQQSGVVSMALDYESRAAGPPNQETCGTGLYSDLEYESVLLSRNRPPKRFPAKFTSIDCSMRLSGVDRYNHKSVPELIIRN